MNLKLTDKEARYLKRAVEDQISIAINWEYNNKQTTSSRETIMVLTAIKVKMTVEQVQGES